MPEWLLAQIQDQQKRRADAFEDEGKQQFINLDQQMLRELETSSFRSVSQLLLLTL